MVSLSILDRRPVLNYNRHVSYKKFRTFDFGDWIFGHFWSLFRQISDKNFGNFWIIVNVNSTHTKHDVDGNNISENDCFSAPWRFYRYTDGKIRKLLSSRYVFQGTYQTRETVLHRDIQPPKRELKIRVFMTKFEVFG